MADKPVVHIGENSPEWVAYKLMHDILITERKTPANTIRKDILDTYAECLQAVRGRRVANKSGNHKAHGEGKIRETENTNEYGPLFTKSCATVA
jgi:hypothetical protein